jgi:hypothetical protein
VPNHETVVNSFGDFVELHPTMNAGKIRIMGPVWLKVTSVRFLGPCIVRLNRYQLVQLRDAIDRILNREE